MLLLVVIVWLDELLELVDCVDSVLGLLLDSVDLLLIEDCGELELLLELLLDSVEDESVLLERLDSVDRLLLLVETLEVLEVLSELSVDELSVDELSVLVDEDDSVLELSVDALLWLDSLISSTLTIRRSWAICEPCCWPL